MHKVMKFFNFGESFIKWVKLLYQEPLNCIKNNGYLSEQINISRGIRQGCPVSGLLFILAAEVLALQIRSSKSLKGFLIGNNGKHVKISQYADDGILYLNDKDEICCAINIISKFGMIAGTLLNIGKCEGLCLGSNKQIATDLFGIKWKNSIRCLGIYVGWDYAKNYQMNRLEKLEKIKSCLEKWKNRDLTLFGRIQVIKVLALPQVDLPATLLHMPQNVIFELNRMFYNFLWGKVERLKRLKVIKKQSDGGLGMVDLDSLFSSFKAAWISRIFKADPENDNWVQFPISLLSQLGGLDVLREFSFEKCSEMPELDHISLFYKDVIVSYSKAFTLDFEMFKNTILNQPLWGNRFITVRKRDKKKVLLLRNWIRSGVRYVKDVMFIDGIVDRAICDLIEDKRNIHIEYLYVKKALLLYANYILLAQNQNMQLLYERKDVNTKSKMYYIDFLCRKVSNIAIMSPFLHPYCIKNDIDERTVFVRRVCQEREKKLKEFNFKVLHGILPCGVNLKKWKIRNTNICDVCDEEQTIAHLLFECEYLS